MTLTLRIVRNDGPDMGVSPELVLNNRGANIGRAMTCEWVLPDDGRVVSSKHCEVQFRDNAYFLIDYGSTNGTFVGESRDRLDGAHRIAPGDRFRIGPYVIEARLAGAALHAHETGVESAMAAARGPDFGDWHDVPGGRPAPPPPPPPQGYAEGGGWDMPQAAPDRNSIWSEDAARGTGAASADDIFGNFTAKNEVDWNNAAWSVEADFDPFRVDPADGGGFAPLAGASAAPQPGGGDPFAPLAGGGGSGGGFGALPGTPTAPALPPSGGGGGFAPMPGIPDAMPSPPAGGSDFAPLPGQGAPPPPAAPPAAPDPFSGGSFAPLDGGAAPFPAAAPPSPAEPTAAPWPETPAHEPTMGAWAPAAPDPAAPPPPQPVRVRPSPVAHSPAPPPQAYAPAPEPIPTPLQAAPAAQPPAMPDAVFAALLGELGVPAAQLKVTPEEAGAKAGRMLRHLIAGLMILLEARARAKEEMGAAGTALSFDGNNPLKFARNVDQALVMMLNPHLRGYMEAEGAIEESYRDLQAHQIATLKAMQGALRETLGRFSPAAIKARTKEQGLLAKVLPGQREAALWKAYEAQFSGVAEGSAEAFLEVFSREFRKAYEESSQPQRR
jgi:type VI secretion system FHA domain protein